MAEICSGCQPIKLSKINLDTWSFSHPSIGTKKMAKRHLTKLL